MSVQARSPATQLLTPPHLADEGAHTVQVDDHTDLGPGHGMLSGQLQFLGHGSEVAGEIPHTPAQAGR